VVLFAWGEIDYMKQVTPPNDAIDVRITGQKWFWTVDYPAVPGAQLNNELIVPVGKPMRLTMTSTDVIHSFFIPVFRLKKDVVPGRYTVMWFEATKEGEYPLFCTEYCGDQHSGMIGKVQVVSAEKYDDPQGAARLEYDPAKGDKTQADFGKRVYERPRLRQLPQPRRLGQDRPDLQGPLRQDRVHHRRQHDHRRGQLHPRETYNQVFTLHGAVMVFLFIIPSVPAALGNFLLPLMLGAKDVAFPKLNLLLLPLLRGAVFFVAALLTGGLDTGWTFYTPYSTTTGTAVIRRPRAPSSSGSRRSSPA
jgi:hypothetical protein